MRRAWGGNVTHRQVRQVKRNMDKQTMPEDKLQKEKVMVKTIYDQRLWQRCREGRRWQQQVRGVRKPNPIAQALEKAVYAAAGLSVME